MSLQVQSEFLRYLVDLDGKPDQRLPAIQELAQQLGISSSKLREQLEVARMMGLVEVRPKTGIRTRGYSFLPCLQASLSFALMIDPGYFELLGSLRDHLEAAYWHEAVRLLRTEDKQQLQSLIERAWQMLEGNPIQIPHLEHRNLHLTIYSRLNNPLVTDLLEAYWDAYETVGLNVYSDYKYLKRVWSYHQEMVDAIIDGNYDAGHRALVEHVGMLHYRPELSASVPKSRLGEKSDLRER
ncbi:MAG: FadR family transcriptional regulator [Anaerolineaceae bacterium]|nr:MAG: FadR family transcriptional regulator [Anaerolineaceae bacterium]